MRPAHGAHARLRIVGVAEIARGLKTLHENDKAEQDFEFLQAVNDRMLAYERMRAWNSNDREVRRHALP